MTESFTERDGSEWLTLSDLELDLELLDESAIEEADDLEWSPVPLKTARAWLKANPDAAFQMNFPTVYEEDRSIKLKDIATAQGLDYISRQRAATQAAQELGFEDYEFAKEMHDIAEEQKVLPQAGGIGAGDDVARSVISPPSDVGAQPPGVPREPGGPVTAEFGAGVDAAKPKRDALSAPVQHAFRKQQKETQRLALLVTHLIETQREMLARLSAK